MFSEEKIERLQKHVASIMEEMGYDLNHPSLKDTPRRVAKFYSEFLGYTDDNIYTTFPEKSNQMIILKQIPFTSLCEHHMLPFHGHISIAYLSGDHILGISKLARIAQLFAHRLQVQERLGEQIADKIEEILPDVRGVGVRIVAHHTCMSMRGIKAEGQMVTTVLRGAFDDYDTKQEFLDLVK